MSKSKPHRKYTTPELFDDVKLHKAFRHVKNKLGRIAELHQARATRVGRI